MDINPVAEPDIVASMTDMPMVKSGSVSAVWSSHALEHLMSHDVLIALKEFHRVLDIGGHVLLRLPDLEKAAELVLEIGLHGIVYKSPSGPITPLDMIFGHAVSIAEGQSGMRHCTGFTRKSISDALSAVGFENVDVVRNKFDLWARADKRSTALG